MAIKQSAEIAQFYREIQEWIDAGCQCEVVFNRTTGLCATIYNWAFTRYGKSMVTNLQLELKEQLISVGFDTCAPFNNGEIIDFLAEADDCTLYDNSARLAWIKVHAIPASDVTEQSEG